MRKLYLFILNHTIAVLFILFSAGLTIAVFHLYKLSEQQVQETAIQNARAYTKALSTFRSLYTSEVVATAKKNGLIIAHDYKDKSNAIPLPATLTILIGKQLSSELSGTESKLYSPFPFPWRSTTGGLRDQFSRDAWQALQNNLEQSYFSIETTENSKSLRFATADLMEINCIPCHNSHPKTPKNDWVVGDLRGILEVIVPIKSATIFANKMVYRTAYILIGTLCITLLCIAFVLQSLRDSNIKYEELNKALNLEVAHRKTIQDKLLKLTSIDPLTGIANRRKFKQVYDTQWLSAIRNQKSLAIIMIDIDYFKSYNDNYGHQLGDEALKIIAKELSESLSRPNDLVARYGGEEFIVLLPETDMAGALHIGNELIMLIKAKRIRHASSKVDRFITISAGVSCVIPNQKLNQENLINDADKALYLAKDSGRNCLKPYIEQ